MSLYDDLVEFMRAMEQEKEYRYELNPASPHLTPEQIRVYNTWGGYLCSQENAKYWCDWLDSRTL